MRSPNCSSKAELKKGPWTREEDQKLLAYIEQHGHGSWRTLPPKAGLERCGKSCRLRWTNYLRPDIKRGKFSPHEEKAIIRLHALLGNRWSAIAVHLPNRTDNEIKNYWNTRLKKRLTRMGIDPVTHKPKNNQAGSAQSSHMAQWEAARLEAEARLTRDSKLLSNISLLYKPTAARSPPPPSHTAAPPPCLDVLKVWQATGNPSCFFSSAGTLESPTSTLNFYCNSPTVPTVSSVTSSDVMYTNGARGVGHVDSNTAMKGNIENSMLQLHDDDLVYPVSCEFDTMGAMDLAALDGYYDVAGSDFVGEFEDGRNYWNELLYLVSSSMEASPTW